MTENETNSSPEFPFEIGWTRNYEDLFRGTYTATTDIADILGKATGHGRVMLCGKGGSGKTTIVLRVRESAQRQGFSTVFVNMARWSPKLHEMLERLDADPLARANFFLENTQKSEPSVPSETSLEWD